MKENYAILPDRIKAAVIDGIVLIAMMYGFSELFALFENVPTVVRIIVSVAVFVLYDPILTSVYGGTMGHSYSGIAVKQENNQEKNIKFHLAFIRFLGKTFLGWISLLTVTGNDKKKAIHDFMAGSVVIKEEE